MILSFIKKISALFLLTLSVQVFAENSYFHEDFIKSPFYNYIESKNKRLFLIKEESENLYSIYNNSKFNEMFFSVLYEDNSFVIYINNKMLKRDCVFAFQFYELSSCKDPNMMILINNFIKNNPDLLYEYEENFNYFLFYHEFSHLLIYEETGSLDFDKFEFLADLMALEMMWYFHEVDYREELFKIRKNSFYFKTDSQFKFYMKYLDYSLKFQKNSFNIEDWFSDILAFSEKIYLTTDDKKTIKEKSSELNKKISKELIDLNEEDKLKDLKEYYMYFRMKTSSDKSVLKRL
jgi:hypothetical protein